MSDRDSQEQILGCLRASEIERSQLPSVTISRGPSEEPVNRPEDRSGVRGHLLLCRGHLAFHQA